MYKMYKMYKMYFFPDIDPTPAPAPAPAPTPAPALTTEPAPAPRDDIVVNVIGGSTPEQQLEVLKKMIEESKQREAELKKQLDDAQKTNLHLAMTMSTNGNNGSESFDDILRAQPYYKNLMKG